VLAQIASVIGDNNVSIESMVQLGRGEEATLLFITHSSPEKDHRKAVEALGSLEVVRQVASVIRVLIST
jgi:homoserine dehydrogenase